MKRYIISILLTSFLVLGIALNGMALPDEDDFDRPPTKELREKIRNRIETLRMWRLTRALDLDEKTAARLFPLLNRYDKKREKIERGIRDDMDALRSALNDKRMSELKDILESLEDKHRELQRLNDEERAELKKVLTPEQQAKYILFQYRFKRDIRRIIEKARRRHLKPPPPPEILPEVE